MKIKEKIGNWINRVKYIIIGLFMLPFIVAAINMLIEFINLDEITFWATTIFWWSFFGAFGVYVFISNYNELKYEVMNMGKNKGNKKKSKVMDAEWEEMQQVKIK